MRTFAQKQKPTQQIKSVNSNTYGRAFFGQNHAVNSITHLQRTIGNQAVLRLLRANTEEIEASSATTTLSRFAHDSSRIPLHAEPHVKIQRKPTISTPGDAYEREADRVAVQVIHMPEPKMQTACACGGGCPKCAAEQSSLDHDLLQTSRVQSHVAGEASAPPIVEEVLRSPGQPLDASTRAFFEPRFGHGFSRVRIHTDAKAAESATGTSALAYTVGEHIAFAANRYAPGTDVGRKLLAHELTHVLQQHPGSLARQPAPPAAPPSPQTVITDANTRRIGTLLFVLSELSDVISVVKLGLEPNPFDFTAQAIQNWLFVSPGDAAFLATVQAAQQLFLRNLGLTPILLHQSNSVQIDPFGNACPPAFAYSRGFEPIFICDNFLNMGPGCQRDVMIHEHFHLLGLSDLLAVSTTAEALSNPDSLSQMAAEIAEGPHTPCCDGAC